MARQVTGEHLPLAGFQQVTPEGESPGLPILTGQSSKGQFSFLASPRCLGGSSSLSVVPRWDPFHERATFMSDSHTYFDTYSF